MEPINNDDPLQSTIAVRRTRDGLIALVSIYHEADPINASGQIYRADLDPSGPSGTILSTNDPLSSLWTSEAGVIWTASANGNVFTTLPKAEPVLNDPSLVMNNDDERFHWTAMSLPRRLSTGLRPNVVSLWGSSDSDIFAACFEGCVYYWNGTRWTEMDTGISTPINEIYGGGPSDVYCVGNRSVILHFDGREWHSSTTPEEIGEDTVITGIRTCGQQTYAVTLRGHILKEQAGHFSLAYSGSEAWSGIAYFQNRWILSANPGGAWELQGDVPQPIRQTFAATEVCEAGDLLFFIETDQPKGPKAIEYDPSQEPAAWHRRGF